MDNVAANRVGQVHIRVNSHHDAGHVDTVGSEYYSEVEICNRSRQADDDCVRPVPGRDHGR